MTPESFDVLVLGGGISGLTAGFRLAEKGLAVRVCEAAPEPGGAIRTWRHDGFLFELGPNTVLDNAPEISALCEAVGALDARIGAESGAKRRFIVKGGRLVALPSGPPGFLKTPVFSWRAKLRILREPFISRAKEEESIATFVRRRLGQEFLDYAVGPFVSGVYAGDPEKLSVRHATAKIHALEEKYGSLIRGAIAKRKGPEPGGGLFSFRDGLDTLPRTIAARLGDAWCPSTRVIALEPGGTGGGSSWRVRVERNGTDEEWTARAVVTAMPATVTADVLAPLGSRSDDSGSAAKRFADAIRELPYADVAVVCLGFRREQVGHALDGFGFLAPAVENRHVLGCLFPSTLFPGRAPEGHVALSAFTGGACHPERVSAEPDRVLADTLADLRPLLAISGEPVISRVERWRPAIPQYIVGHGSLKEAAARFEERCPGVFISGNLLWGVSVADCIRNPTNLAERVAKHVASTP